MRRWSPRPPAPIALAEGDWWNDTAIIRRKRDVIIMSQRGAGGSTPNLDCFDARTTEPARARRRAVTEQQEREILLRCRADLDKRKIDLACTPRRRWPTTWPTSPKAMPLKPASIIYGISYGTRWALEMMRRHPGLVRAAVLDGVYPPQVNGEQNEPEIVRTRLRAALCRVRRRHALPRAQSRPAPRTSRR